MKQATLSVDPGPGERLESWKEIATFLGKGVRTVQRWERTEGLPVRRHLHERSGTVYAFKGDLLEWYRTRQSTVEAEESEAETAREREAPSRSWKRRGLWAAAGIVASVVIVLLVWPRTRYFGGVPTKVVSVVGRASQSVLSPDGKKVAFAWNGERESGNLDIYLASLDGNPLRRLTDDPNNEHSPAWSPDGRSLAFLRDNIGVFVMDAPGQPARMIVRQEDGAVFGVSASWSPDGRLLYYSERRGGSEGMALWRVGMLNGVVEQISRPAEAPGDMYPKLSPDGSKLAFIRQTRSLTADVYISSPDPRADGEPERVTFDGSRIAGVDWTPDGRSLVFSSDRSGSRRLWVARLDWPARRRSPEPLPLAGEEAFQPSVAHRAKRLVYSRRHWPADIWRLDLTAPGRTGGSPAKLIASAGENITPAWAPDGRRIAYVSMRSGHTEIWRSNADGGEAVQMTNFRGPITGWPAWSPDGKWIAFHSGPRGRYSVFVIPAEGGTPQRLTPEGVNSYQPAWAHDGRNVFYTCTHSGENAIWSIPFPAGSPARITAGGGDAARLSADGELLYFRRQGLWRMRLRSREEEHLIEDPIGTYTFSGPGIYFDRGFGDYAEPEIHYFDLNQRISSLLFRFERRKATGMSISPDGRQLLVPLNDRQSSEIILVGTH